MEKAKIIFPMIEPKEWEDTHIESHNVINRCMVQIWDYLTEIQEELGEVKIFSTRAAENSLAAFSEIREDFNQKIWNIKHQIDNVNIILGGIIEEIKELKDNSNKWRKYLIKHYEWILDTETQILTDLDKIELDGTYLVNIVENDIVENADVVSYTCWHTVIANWEYTPKVYLLSKEWWHAVLEYEFTVLLTEI